ncbi:hypothetical protein [Streptomyces sp. NPDC048669]|uniref:hypothetical protein n=1 Tax=Streptomyces sp. NPDC048669 TaxID=3155267 RepID=UPI003415775F
MLLFRTDQIPQAYEKSKRLWIKAPKCQIRFAAEINIHCSSSLLCEFAGSYKELTRITGKIAKLQSRKLSYQRMGFDSEEGVTSSPGSRSCDARTGEGVNYKPTGGQLQLM